jgi:tryptophan synthase alpha chain
MKEVADLKVMSRISEKFATLRRQNRKGFIPYITAGDPDLASTEELILVLEQNGADIIELGVPFSDPMADGPIIQRASERALRNGVTTRDCLSLVKRLRERSQIPIVLFSYLNPLLSLGLDTLGEQLRDAGIDGVLATDLVPEEAVDYRKTLHSAGIDTVFLVAPTSTDERLKLIAGTTSGFVYAVSRTGVTGVRQSLSEAAEMLTRRLRQFTELPIAVGFGISGPEHVREVWAHADAAVVGSLLVREIELSGKPQLAERVGAMTRRLIGRDAAASD